MKRTSYINDKTDFSDESKIIHHLFYGEMVNFEKKRKSISYLLYGSVALIIIGIVLLLTPIELNLLAYGLMVVASSGGGAYYFLNKANRIHLNIKKLGLVYLPVTRAPLQNGSVLIDRSGLVNPVKFNFNSLDNEDITTVDALHGEIRKHISEMPLVLSIDKTDQIDHNDMTIRKENLKLYSEEKTFIDLNEKITTTFNRKKQYQVELSAIKSDREFYNFLKEIQIEPGPVIEKISTQKLNSDLNLINGVVEMYKGSSTAEVDIDILCGQILTLLWNILPRYDYSVHNSLKNIIVPTAYKQTNLIDEASYNFYCPVCNAVLMKQLLSGKYEHGGKSDHRVTFPSNTKMRMIDFESDTWKCPLCNNETNKPLRKHKMEDELFTPVYDKLYEENYLERLRVYNNINDQKRSYIEKAETNFHEVFRETRAKVDNLKSRIRTFNAEIESDAASIASLNSVITKQKMIEASRSREIASETASLKSSIAEESRRSRQEIDNIVSKAKEDIAETTSKYAYLEREDQSMRDKIQKDIAESAQRTASSNEDHVRLLLGKKMQKNY